MPRVGFVHQNAEIFVGAVIVFNRVIIDDIVAMIAGRLHDRHEPDAGHAEIVRRGRITIVEIVQLLDHAEQIVVLGERAGPTGLDGQRGQRSEQERQHEQRHTTYDINRFT
jgi:hypothetical protein